MNKIVLKTALLTIAALAVAALAVFSLWILCSPQTMAGASERIGNYSFAVTCAALRYKYTKNANDLARCAEDGILSGKDKYVIEYGEKLVSHEKYAELCAKKNEQLSQTKYGELAADYNGYICGHLAAAQYRKGDTAKAVETAQSGGAGAFARLVIAVADKSDKQAAQTVLDALNKDAAQNTENLKNILLQIIG